MKQDVSSAHERRQRMKGTTTKKAARSRLTARQRTELEALAAAYPNFQYRPTLFHRDGPLPDVLATAHPKLSGWRGFVCGDPQIVNLLKKRLFLAGMASRAISADAFLPTTLK